MRIKAKFRAFAHGLMADSAIRNHWKKLFTTKCPVMINVERDIRKETIQEFIDCGFLYHYQEVETMSGFYFRVRLTAYGKDVMYAQTDNDNATVGEVSFVIEG